jgi:hypothetical protein
VSQGGDLRAFMMKVGKDQASTATRAISLRVLSGVVLRTPVDTGRARANWQVDVGAGKSGEVEAEDKGGGGTITAGGSVIARQRDFQQVALTNNLPYIEKLEGGSSKQAPGPASIVGMTLVGLGLTPGSE